MRLEQPVLPRRRKYRADKFTIAPGNYTLLIGRPEMRRYASSAMIGGQTD